MVVRMDENNTNYGQETIALELKFFAFFRTMIELKATIQITA
jgi:hypothetical protein